MATPTEEQQRAAESVAMAAQSLRDAATMLENLVLAFANPEAVATLKDKKMTFEMMAAVQIVGSIEVVKATVLHDLLSQGEHEAMLAAIKGAKGEKAAKKAATP